MKAPNQQPRYGSRLTEILDARGIKYAWLARQVGYQRAYLSHVKAGRYSPSATFRARAAQVLGLPEDVVFFPLPVQDSDETELPRTEGPEAA